MLFYKGISDIKDDILGALKVFFSMDDDFKYSLHDQAASYLKIYSSYPQESVSYPCIVATNCTMKPIIVGIGSETKQYLTIGGMGDKEFGGQIEYVLTLDCSAKSPTGREQLTERVVFALHWIARSYLEEGGIVVTNISSSGESDTPYGTEKIYTHTISVPFWTEWSEILNLDMIEAINVRMNEIADIKFNKNVTTSDAIETWSKKLLNSE